MNRVICCLIVGIVLFSENVKTFSFEDTINHVLKTKALNNKSAEHIDLSYHGITEVSINDFKDMYKLKFLYMKKNSIHLLQVGVFQDTYMLNKLDLSYNEIKELSGGIFANLTLMKSLILNNNFITVIEKNVFNDMKALTKLKLDDNRISHLDADIFTSNRQLEELDLSFNYIQTLDQNIFKHLTKIRILSIDNNKIKHLEVGVFQNNVKLNYLWLSGNHISNLENDMFGRLSNLIALYLNNNVLKHIDRDVFQHCNALEILDLRGNQLQYLNNTKIETFDVGNTLILHDNPWICNCSLIPTYTVWRRTESISPRCYGPKGLENKAWSTLNESDFVCDSYTTMKYPAMKDDYNKNITTNTQCDKIYCIVCFIIALILFIRYP